MFGILNSQKITFGSKQIQSKYVIYVLLLENDHIYVGKSTPENLDRRIQDHIDRNDRGSQWTKLYPVVRQLKQFYQYNRSPFDQDRKVKEMMYLFGPDKVRGGSYSNTNQLSEQQLNIIEMERRGAFDLCFKCGELKHFAKKCNKKNIKNITHIQQQLPINQESKKLVKKLQTQNRTQFDRQTVLGCKLKQQNIEQIKQDKVNDQQNENEHKGQIQQRVQRSRQKIRRRQNNRDKIQQYLKRGQKQIINIDQLQQQQQSKDEEQEQDRLRTKRMKILKRLCQSAQNQLN